MGSIAAVFDHAMTSSLKILPGALAAFLQLLELLQSDDNKQGKFIGNLLLLSMIALQHNNNYYHQELTKTVAFHFLSSFTRYKSTGPCFSNFKQQLQQ
jgi:hypothetical protein